MDVDVAAPPVEAPSAPEVESTVETSLADHEAQFGPSAQRNTQPTPTNGAAADTPVDDADTERDPGGRFRKRAQSHQATSKDVDQIAELTKRLRQAEADAGLKIEKQAGESDRAFSLRRQAEMAEAVRDARKATSTPVPTPAPQTRQQSAPIATQADGKPAPFAEPLPKPEDFATADDPATEYYRAIAGHEFRRQIHDAQQAILAQRQQQSQQEAIAKSHEIKAALDAKMAEFEKTTPDFQAALDKVNVPELNMPNVMIQAIVSDVDTAPKLMYYLATHPDDLEDAIAFAIPFADDLSAPSVALVRRRLNRYVRDIGVQKGAPPPAQQPILVAPRPPTPLGTGPLKTGDGPPSDESSLLEHEKYFGLRKRR